MITIKDANDQWVCIQEESFFEAFLENKLTIVGIPMEGILTFKRLYEAEGGTHPITEESIISTLKRR